MELTADPTADYACQGCWNEIASWKVQRIRGKSPRPFVLLHLCDECRLALARVLAPEAFAVVDAAIRWEASEEAYGDSYDLSAAVQAYQNATMPPSEGEGE
jgi:hypothetical protein